MITRLETPYLDHILECCEHIDMYASEGEEVFKTRGKTYGALLRRLQIMAESCKRLQPETKQQIAADWNAIAGLRNVLVHDYLGTLDDSILWRVITYHVPELVSALREYREKL